MSIIITWLDPFETLFRSHPGRREALQAARADLLPFEDSKRAQILQFIQSHPGTHLRNIKRELNLAMGVLQYHLYRLEREEKIIGHRRGLYKRFYPERGFEAEEQEILSVLLQETERDLLLYLLRTPDATQKELSEYARISPSSTSWHMKRLVRTGIVQTRRQGSFSCYMVKGDPALILRLLRKYHPRIWDTWAERLADILT